MLDWLIVGGGIHGTALSFYLTRIRRLPHASIRVLDPFPEAMAQWKHFTGNVGMAFLRSPHIHSLDADPWSISTFARTRSGQPLAAYIPTHNRPALDLFHAHSQCMIERHRLDELRLQGRATALNRIDGGWCVESDQGAIAARHVVLALGAGEQPAWPEWARDAKAAGVPIQHVFDADFDRAALPHEGQTVVIGAGISAAQLALSLANNAPGRVTLLMRGPARLAAFDSDLCWVSDICLRAFHETPDYAERRRIIKQARNKGTMPQDVADALNAAQRSGLLTVRLGDTVVIDYAKYNWRQPGTMYRALTIYLTDATMIPADRVILATGFDTQRPGGALIDHAIADNGLLVAADGYPLVSPSLAWADGLYVSGPLAELEIGPPSRNIIGARFAAQRIGAAIA